MSQPPKKQQKPDTVRLKKDIAKDHAEHTADSKVITKGVGEQEFQFRAARADKALNREVARQDSLRKIRAKRKP